MATRRFRCRISKGNPLRDIMSEVILSLHKKFSIWEGKTHMQHRIVDIALSPEKKGGG